MLASEKTRADAEHTRRLRALTAPLLIWYREHARALPWRAEPSPYRVLLSEVMLQQTRAAAVTGYFDRFLAALPSVSDLAGADDDTLLKLWQGLGYYNRARNLRAAARHIMDACGGVFPSEYEDILRLPGVGPYTAGAVASIAFGRAVPAVDGNALRVLSRVCGDGADIAKTETRRRWRETLSDVIPADCPGDFNQALMELGATVCLPNGAPLCARCPAEGLCLARLHGRTAELPVKAPARPRRAERRVVFLIFHENRVALRRRPARGLLAGLWEYPNENAPAEGTLSAWGISGAVSDAGAGVHVFTHLEWHMTGRAVEAETDALPDGWRWADGRALRRELALPSAFRCFERAVAGRVGSLSVQTAER